MKVTISYSTPHAKPRPGDRRTTKKHGLQIRTWDRATGMDGKPTGYIVSYNRPRFSWTSPQDLMTWDRHYLTQEEMDRFFPPEREAGYMQMRGAA